MVALRSKLRFVSQSAIASVIDMSRKEPLPDIHGRRDIRKARDVSVKVVTPYGPIHQEITVADGYVMEIQHPMAMMYLACKESRRFSDLMLWAFEQKQPTAAAPWGIVLYSDEINPGNQLAYQHSRKAWGFYWTFEEFGPFTSDEDIWFEVAVVRTSECHRLPGGVCRLVKNLLLKAFFDKDGHHFELSGARFVLHDNSDVLVFASLAEFLADADALPHMFGCKTSAGLKCCTLCLNVFNGLTPRDVVARTAGAVYHSCSDSTKFVLATPGWYDSVVNRLRAQVALINKGEFEELEIKLGWIHNPEGVMFDDRCRVLCYPCNVLRYDWCHNFFVNGAFNSQAGLLVHELHSSGKFKAPDVFGVVSKFNWPKHLDVKPAAVFRGARIKTSLKERTLKCSASEGLALFPVLAYICELLLGNPDVRTQVIAACFLKLALVIGMVLRAARGLSDSNVMRSRADEWVKAFTTVHGAERITPKFHFIQHLWQWLPLLACFVHERKHKHLKQFMDHLKNLNCPWDASILREVTSMHIERLKAADDIQMSPKPALSQGKKPSRRMLSALRAMLGDTLSPDDIMVSQRARASCYDIVSVGDVVAVGHLGAPKLCKIEMLLSVADEDGDHHAVCVIEWLTLTAEHVRFWKCHKSAERDLIHVSDVGANLVWAGEAHMTVLKPLHATLQRDI